MKKAAVFVILIMILLVFTACKQEPSTGVVTPSGNGNGGSVTQDTSAGDSGTADTDDSDEPNPADEMVAENTKIDLAVIDAYFSPTFLKAGEETTLKFIVKNQGVQDSGSFGYTIKVMKDGSVVKEEKGSVNPLGRGEQKKIEKDFTFSSAGQYSAEVYVDKENKIGEVIETNNVMKAKADAIVTS